MHPQGRECTPESEQESNFFEEIGEMWTVGEIIQVVLVCVFRATTKIKVVNFFGQEKCTPDKILATPMAVLRRSSKFVNIVLYGRVGRKHECQRLIVNFHCSLLNCVQ